MTPTPQEPEMTQDSETRRRALEVKPEHSVDRLRKCARAIFLAVDIEPARDISGNLAWAADTITALERERDALKSDLSAAQVALVEFLNDIKKECEGETWHDILPIIEYHLERAPATAQAFLADVERLRGIERLINAPEIMDFIEGVKREAAHQVVRWGSDHDAGKTTADWIWLIGYVAGKAMAADKAGNNEKLMHHIITTAAVCLNWHHAVSGFSTSMRPGTLQPDESASLTAVGVKSDD